MTSLKYWQNEAKKLLEPTQGLLNTFHSPGLRTIRATVTSKVIGEAITWPYPYDNGILYKIPTYEMRLEGVNGSGLSVLEKFEVIRFGVSRKTPSSAPYTVGLAEKQTHVIKQWLPNYTVHSAPSVEDGAWQVYGNFLIHDGPDDPLDQNEPYATIGCVEVCGGPKGFIIFNSLVFELSGITDSTLEDALLKIGRSSKFFVDYEKASRPAVVEL